MINAKHEPSFANRMILHRMPLFQRSFSAPWTVSSVMPFQKWHRERGYEPHCCGASSGPQQQASKENNISPTFPPACYYSHYFGISRDCLLRSAHANDQISASRDTSPLDASHAEKRKKGKQNALVLFSSVPIKAEKLELSSLPRSLAVTRHAAF